MNKQLAAVAAASLAAVALAACGGYDPTDAVNTFNKDVNSQIQSSLSSAGLTGSAATDAGVDLKCPTNVEKETPFTCTVTGKLSGKTVDVQMDVNSSDELAPTNSSAFSKSIGDLSTAEGTAVGEAATN